MNRQVGEEKGGEGNDEEERESVLLYICNTSPRFAKFSVWFLNRPIYNFCTLTKLFKELSF